MQRSALISDVKLAYKSALESVEGLDCVDVSRSELLSRIASVQAQYQGSREAVLRLEEQLRGALRDTEARIEEVRLSQISAKDQTLRVLNPVCIDCIYSSCWSRRRMCDRLLESDRCIYCLPYSVVNILVCMGVYIIKFLQ
jgi:hypothetical protein